jgi:hypothetical protein
MKRALQIFSVCLVLGTASVATAGAWAQSGDAPAVTERAGDHGGPFLSVMTRWLFELWTAVVGPESTDPSAPAPTPPVSPTGGPHGDNGSCVDPDGNPCAH